MKRKHDRNLTDVIHGAQNKLDLRRVRSAGDVAVDLLRTALVQTNESTTEVVACSLKILRSSGVVGEEVDDR